MHPVVLLGLYFTSAESHGNYRNAGTLFPSQISASEETLLRFDRSRLVERKIHIGALVLSQLPRHTVKDVLLVPPITRDAETHST